MIQRPTNVDSRGATAVLVLLWMVCNCANLEGPAKARSSRQKPDMAHSITVAFSFDF